ncbi:MAG TPA: DUF378 domain-containing protein [Candidatus Paceibacterota bacterium]|nr:DUF378 domain-containing protein [Candidatus Paceibacterota bacterium]
MKALHVIAFILVIVGGLNWLLVGLGGDSWNVVAMLGSSVARIAYVLVGLSALVLVFSHKKDCKMCEAKASQPTM